MNQELSAPSETELQFYSVPTQKKHVLNLTPEQKKIEDNDLRDIKLRGRWLNPNQLDFHFHHLIHPRQCWMQFKSVVLS